MPTDRSLKDDCTIVNQGAGAWAFEDHAKRLSNALNIDVSTTPRAYNYLLGLDEEQPIPTELFIPINSIRVASDKRLQAERFEKCGVSTPETLLIQQLAEVQHIVQTRSVVQWCLKYPTSCGASGHRMLTVETVRKIRTEWWPTPYIVQEFIPSDEPAVYRTYCAGGELFGWNVRRFPSGAEKKPWVAHAQGARYEILADRAPKEAEEQARAALEASGLLDSFGCVDLLYDTRKNAWLVLEVGTDGPYNHVDRDLGNETAALEIDTRIATAFWSKVSS